MRNKFDEQLALLNKMLIEMGAMIENAILLTRTALINQDNELAKSIIAADNEIDQKERDIEALCLKLLLQQQPIAGDLRLISSALKMITDMERIGDHAEDISEIILMIAGDPYIKKLEHIPQMADATMKMVTNAIDAFVKKDLVLASAVKEYDDVVDNLFDNIKVDLIELIREDASNGEQAIDLIMIAKYFERIGDHAVNIAEWVEFSITGKHAKYKKYVMEPKAEA
jgi:phosphate transport system protein